MESTRKTPTKPNQSKGAKSSKVMSKGGKGKGKGKGKCLPEVNTQVHTGRTTSTSKAGLQFSVARVARFMKQGRYADRIGGGAPVYVSAALQYICSEVIELAGNKAQTDKKHRINPRHIMLAIKEDPELCKLLGNADFAQCGVVPTKINYEKRGKKGKCCADDNQEDDNE